MYEDKEKEKEDDDEEKTNAKKIICFSQIQKCINTAIFKIQSYWVRVSEGNQSVWHYEYLSKKKKGEQVGTEGLGK